MLVVYHKCMKCGKEYSSDELSKLKSCKVCNGNTFMFKAKAVKIKRNAPTKNDTDADIKVLGEGVFEVNVAAAAHREPIIIEGDEGVFFIKFPKKR